MHDRHLFRIGGISSVIGSIVALLGNILHPRTSEIGSAEAFLNLIANSSIWVIDHLALAAAALLILPGLLALSRSITAETNDTAAGAWATIGAAGTIIGVTMFIILMASDGITAKGMAVAWMEASSEEKTAALHAATVIEGFDFALFSLFIVVFFGLTILAYGFAVLGSASYSAWLGWVAVLDGAASTIVGLVQAYKGPSVLLTNVLFPIVSIVGTLWILLIGMQLLQRGATPAKAARAYRGRG